MTTIKDFDFSFSDTKGEYTRIPLNVGEKIFVLGANGTGKSGLMEHLHRKNLQHAKRIVAHRQSWFPDNGSNIPTPGRANYEKTVSESDITLESRWKDQYPAVRANLSLTNLVASVNNHAREIQKTLRLDVEKAVCLNKTETPIETLNELLLMSNIPIKVNMGDDERLFAVKKNGEAYSIAMLSDGEKNAILLVADVLSAPARTLFIIDEPERHLHRSIISPLLTSLFNNRSDCGFVIATHNITLPMDHPESSVLLLKKCAWVRGNMVSWATQLISSCDEIDDETKQSILGSRDNLLFVEGKEGSLDRRFYELLFPEASVIVKGDCKEVEKAVLGIRGSQSLAWVNAVGLIDADDRTESMLEALKSKGVYTLPCYSVESLYYSKFMIGKIASRMADVTGTSGAELEANGIDAIISSVVGHKNRLCARICERKIKEKTQLPGWEKLLMREILQIEVNPIPLLEEEFKKFDALVAAKDIESIVSRYPIRETDALHKVSKALKFQTAKEYEGAVVKFLLQNEEARSHYRNLLHEIAMALTETITKPSSCPTGP
ncbi:MAG: ATPase [Verrucomicrobiales bacterium]|nr:ATPase [Verrucomicrobiales bacterium]